MTAKTTQEKWAKAAADAHDAVARLVELKDDFERAADNVWGENMSDEQQEGEQEARAERLEDVVDLDLDNCLEAVASCEDFEVPEWAQ